MSRASDRELARERRAHVGRLFLELSASFERESLRRLHARGYTGLTSAQKQVIVHLPLAGARLTDLAARAGVTKQAMMRLVDGLEAQGYVERAGDPDDRRAKGVRLTRRGRRLIESGLEVVRELEEEYVRILGATRLARLRGDLAELAQGLGVAMPDPE